jgi:hypothetical protein
MKNSVIAIAVIIFLGAFQNVALAQKAKKEINNWQILSMVLMQKKFDENIGIDVDVPKFGKKVKALDGEIIKIKGYILPLKASKDQKYFVLSAVPFNQCFFCGGAGPESVMEVFSKKPVKSSKKPVTLRGKLQVNYNPSIGQVLYTLKDAEVVEE